MPVWLTPKASGGCAKGRSGCSPKEPALVMKWLVGKYS